MRIPFRGRVENLTCISTLLDWESQSPFPAQSRLNNGARSPHSIVLITRRCVCYAQMHARSLCPLDVRLGNAANTGGQQPRRATSGMGDRLDTGVALSKRIHAGANGRAMRTLPSRV